jgi:hypothetical protein
LLACAEAVRCKDHDEAREFLATYRAWRARGGFEPDMGPGRMGDVYAVGLAKAMASSGDPDDILECPACGGSGYRAGWDHRPKKDSPCHVCHTTGRVRRHVGAVFQQAEEARRIAEAVEHSQMNSRDRA